MAFYYGAIISAEIALAKISEGYQKITSNGTSGVGKGNLINFISEAYGKPRCEELENDPVAFWRSKCQSILPYQGIFLLPVQQGKYLLCGRSLKFPSAVICSAVEFLDAPLPKDLKTTVRDFLKNNGLASFEPQLLITGTNEDLYGVQVC